MYRLIGCAVPYCVQTTNPIVPNGVGRERIERGAFDQQALDDAWLCHVTVNHRKPAIPDAQVSLINGHVGLHFMIDLPDNRAARELMAPRSQWRGVSIGFLHNDCDAHMDWPTLTNCIVRIGWLTQLAIAVDDCRPAYPGTWVAPYSPDAVERVRRANHESLVARLGDDYKERWPRESWAPPLQSTRLEAELHAREPERRFQCIMPWGSGFVR